MSAFKLILLVKKFPMCRFLILADDRPMCISFHAVVNFLPNRAIKIRYLAQAHDTSFKKFFQKYENW